MKKTFALVLVLAMALSMAACGSSGNSGSAATAPVDNAQRTLNLRLDAPLSSLDWENSTLINDMLVWHQMFEGLYGMDESGEGYYEELADGVEVSEDGITWTVHLREGVTFQNGAPLTAEDVVFSYERAMKNSRFNYLTSPIAAVEAADENTVVFTLTAPNAAIAHTFFCIKIVNKAIVEEQGDAFGTVLHQAGTGAYYPVEYNVSAGVKLAAYEGYWRGTPAISSVEYRVIEDDAAAIIAFENGDLDYLSDVALTEWDNVLADITPKGGHSELLKQNNITFTGINYLSESADCALANKNIREAICCAIDKDALNMIVYNGLGYTTNVYMATNYVATQPAEGFTEYSYNPERAVELLAAEGYSKDNPLVLGKILTYGNPTTNNGKIAIAIASQLAEVGIQITPDIREYAAMEEELYSQQFDMCVFSDSGNYDFNNIRQQVHSESVGMYVIRYKDDRSDIDWQRLEELVDLGVSVADVESRLVYYTELWAIVMDSATINPLLHGSAGYVWSADLDIGAPVPTYYKVRTFSWAE